MLTDEKIDTLSTSICDKTGLKVISNSEWIVTSKKCKIVISIVDSNIIRFKFKGYIDLTSNKKTETIVSDIIENHIPRHSDNVQILDLSNLEGSSLATKVNYINIVKKQKRSLAHIYYNASTLSKLSIRLSRKLNRLESGLHMVNTYEEAIGIAQKILLSKLPANFMQLDTTRIPFSFSNPQNFCKAINQPIIRKPEWTDIQLGDNYSATFTVYGDNILYSEPKGKANAESLLHFMEKRAMIIEEAFGSQTRYCEIKNYLDIAKPSKRMRDIFARQLQENRLIGFFYFNAAKGVQFSLNIGAYIIKPDLLVKHCKDFETALLQTDNHIKNFSKKGPGENNSAEVEANSSISPRLLKYYESELLHFLESINWEIYGIESNITEIPSSHPFRFVFEAIGLLKSDLDLLSEERIKANEALLESEKLYRLLAENTDDVIWLAALDLKLIFISPSITRLSGYSVEYLMEHPIDMPLTKESREKVNKLMGIELEKEVSGKYDPQRSLLFELQKFHKDGTKYWTEEKVSFLRDNAGTVIGAIGVSRNINERKIAEEAAKKSNAVLKQTQDQLIQSEKMAALGGLVAGVSHEISTPLGVSVTASSFLHQKAEEFGKLASEGNLTQKAIEKFTSIAIESTSLISNNLYRSAELINSFKQVAVDQSIEDKRDFNLKKYIQEILQSLNPQIKRTKHTIELNCMDNIVIKNYPGAFSQIFTNLIMNSIIHGFEKLTEGSIKIDIYIEDDQLVIYYHDNGKGMTKEVLNQLYNPFYTTKRGTGGTGLGMHITYNIITRKLNGLIECQSNLQEGTTFVIKLQH